MSAASRNEKYRSAEDLTQRYEELCAHYQMTPTRNNRGVAHENGAIESAPGYFKRRLHQALLLRGSTDFESVASYQQFIDAVIDALNAKCHERFESERGYLQPLPAHQSADYEILSVRVTCHSTITCRLMVEGLYLAARSDKEYLVGLWMSARLRDGTLTFRALQAQFATVPAASLTVNTVEQHPLSPYDRLLTYDCHRFCQADFTSPAASPTSPSHETSMAGVGKPGSP